MKEGDDKELEILLRTVGDVELSASPWSMAGLMLPPTILLEEWMSKTRQCIHNIRNSNIKYNKYTF